MALINRDAALSRPPMLKTRTIAVSEFGDDAEIAVRALTARQRWEFGQLATKAADPESDEKREPTSYLISVAAIDDAGQRMFTAQDVDVIETWSGDVVDRIGTAIMEISGLSRDAADKAGKDSAKTANSPSPSSSHATSDAPTAS